MRLQLDIVLIQPRNGLTTWRDILNPLLDAQSQQLTLGIQPPPPGQRLRVNAMAKWTGQTVEFDWLNADFTDATWDELLLATVWLVSPPDTPAGSATDNTWAVYVEHRVFWNLNWAQPLFPRQSQSTPLSFFLPLAGGMAQPIVNSLLASVNDANNAASLMEAAHSMEGRFWTT